MSVTLALILLTTAIVVFQSLLIVHLFRRHEEISHLVESINISTANTLEVGKPIPALRARDARSGIQITLDYFHEGGGLLFLSAKCGACARVLDSLTSAALRKDLVVFWEGPPTDALASLDATCPVVLIDATQIASVYHVKAFPDLILVSNAFCLLDRINPTSYAEVIGSLNTHVKQTLPPPTAAPALSLAVEV